MVLGTVAFTVSALEMMDAEGITRKRNKMFVVKKVPQKEIDSLSSIYKHVKIQNTKFHKFII